MITPLARLVASAALAGTLAAAGCATGSADSDEWSGHIDSKTPETMLASLQGAATQSLNAYYDTLLQFTDCEALPEMCRLVAARADAAREMIELRAAMIDRYGDLGREAATDMLRSAFLGQFEEVERASVLVGSSGEAAVLRIGTSVYRLRRRGGDWRIVQFPDPPYDPATTADAIEILVERIDAIRREVVDGKIGSMQELELRIATALGGR